MTVVLEPVETDRQALRVLLVDDTEDARALLRIKLETQEGFEIVGEAADGHDAVDQARRLRPDLVILDLAMPGMDGLEALPLVRAAAPDAGIVVHTVFHPETLKNEALAAGADRYVVKGGTMRDLMNVIDVLLGDR